MHLVSVRPRRWIPSGSSDVVALAPDRPDARKGGASRRRRFSWASASGWGGRRGDGEWQQSGCRKPLARTQPAQGGDSSEARKETSSATDFRLQPAQQRATPRAHPCVQRTAHAHNKCRGPQDVWLLAPARFGLLSDCATHLRGADAGMLKQIINAHREEQEREGRDRREGRPRWVSQDDFVHVNGLAIDA